MKVLITEPLAEDGIILVRAHHDVDIRLGMSPAELKAALPDYDALIVRSETKVTADVIEAGTRLQVIARAGVGVDNVDVAAATKRGIAVVNSPEGNTMAATEHTLALILALSRNLPQAVASLKAGEWKRSRFTGVELYHKTLGVLGFGKIGREVARRALGFEMKVLTYDPYVLPEQASRMGVELVTKEDLLKRSDFITIHLPLNTSTRGSIGDREFQIVRPGVRIVNCARGGIINEDALIRAIDSGIVAGAALDVFAKEPPPADSPLLCHPKIVATPHLGASTTEAQVGVAVDVAEQVADILSGKPARSAVNMPGISPEMLAQIGPFMTLAEKMGRLAAALIHGHVRTAAITFSGDIVKHKTDPVTRCFLTGLLQPALEETVNLINAAVVAEQRGICVTESTESSMHVSGSAFTSRLSVSVTGDDGPRTISGTVIANEIRIISIDGYRVDLVPEGVMLISTHTDKPGMIGKVGTLLGSNQINIAGMHLGRATPRGRAVMVLSVDEPVPPDVLAQLTSLDGMQSTTLVEF